MADEVVTGAVVEVQPGAAAAVDTNPAPTEDQALGAIFDKLVTNNGAERGAAGKYASPNAKEAPVGGEAEAGGEQENIQQPPAATAAPAHLPQSIKNIWDKLPEEGRAEVAKLTGEWDRKFGEQGKQMQPMKQVYDRLQEAISKHPDFNGLTPDDLGKGAARLAAVQVAFTRNPVGTLVDLADSAGIREKLVQALGVKVEAGDQSQIITGMQQKIDNLQRQLEQTLNPERFRETVSSTIEKTMAEREAETSLAGWSKDQTFYADVEAEMPGYVAKAIEKLGKDRPATEYLTYAYDMAINANPEVRAKVRAAEAKATAANPDPKRAADARKAASINVKSSANGKDRTMTEEEAMGAAWDRSMAAH